MGWMGTKMMTMIKELRADRFKMMTYVMVGMLIKELVMGYMCEMGMNKELMEHESEMGTRVMMGMRTRMIMGVVGMVITELVKELVMG